MISVCSGGSKRFFVEKTFRIWELPAVPWLAQQRWTWRVTWWPPLWFCCVRLRFVFENGFSIKQFAILAQFMSFCSNMVLDDERGIKIKSSCWKHPWSYWKHVENKGYDVSARTLSNFSGMEQEKRATQLEKTDIWHSNVFCVSARSRCMCWYVELNVFC